MLAGNRGQEATQRTSTSLGELGQAKKSVVTGDGLECNVRVPLGLLALALVLAEEAVEIQLLGLNG